MTATAELTTLVRGIESWICIHGHDKFIEQLPLVSDRPLIEGKSLTWRNRTYNLSSSPMALELCRIFNEHPLQRLSKFDLIHALYGETRQFSETLRRAIDHNVVKRLSRARLYLRDIMGDEGKNLRWFHYDPNDGFWYLLKNSFV